MWGWRSVQHPDYADRVIQQLERAREAEEPWEDTFPLLSKEGKYSWFLARAVPIRDSQGSLVRWFGTGTDISGQIAAEEQIRNLNAQLQERVAELEAIMQVLPVGVAVSQDPESNVVTANLALSDLLGVTPGENIATRIDPDGADSFGIYKEGRRLASADHPAGVCLGRQWNLDRVRPCHRAGYAHRPVDWCARAPFRFSRLPV